MNGLEHKTSMLTISSGIPVKNLRLPLGRVYSTGYPLKDCDDTTVGCDEIDKDPAGFVRVALLPYLRLVSRLVQKPSGLAGNFRPGPVRPIFR